MTRKWVVEVMWADGMAMAQTRLRFAGEGEANRCFGRVQAAMEMGAELRRPDDPAQITLTDDFGQIVMFGRLIRSVHLINDGEIAAADLAARFEIARQQGYALELGKDLYSRRAPLNPEEE